MRLGQFAAGLLVAGVVMLASGCALFTIPAAENLGTTVGSMGGGVSGLTGMIPSQSTVAVDNSWVKDSDAQAHYYREQTAALARHHHEELAQRAASVGILKSMAALDNDPQLSYLANWVEAGGDPRFALSYGLARDRNDVARGRAVRILEDMSKKRSDPVLYEMAQWVRAGGDQKFALKYALSKGVRFRESGRKEIRPQHALARARSSGG